jgi:elongation factor 1-beta
VVTQVLRMATAGIRFKVMPEGVDTDLEELKTKIKAAVETFESGVFNDTKEEPIAFGLKALIVTIALSQDEESEAVEKAFLELEGVSSVEMIDYRQVVG